jgi:hypothetical protein
MATLAQKIEAEKRMRDLLEESGLPQPDYVEYGFTCIRLFFNDTKQIVVIDIDDPEGVDPGLDKTLRRPPGAGYRSSLPASSTEAIVRTSSSLPLATPITRS